jgi:hypothetical protein
MTPTLGFASTEIEKTASQGVDVLGNPCMMCGSLGQK